MAEWRLDAAVWAPTFSSRGQSRCGGALRFQFGAHSCGLELTHLDTRRLLIRTSPDKIVKPMARGFDPMARDETDWQVIDDCGCPSRDHVAQEDTTGVETCVRASTWEPWL